MVRRFKRIISELGFVPGFIRCPACMHRVRR
jgi:hypothetical protein